MKDFLGSNFPKWELLSDDERQRIIEQAVTKTYQKGDVVHRSSDDCRGILLIKKGQLRPYIVSEEGREVTLFRVQSGDVCILTASCLMDAITVDIMIEAIEKTEVVVVPSAILHEIAEKHMELELFLYKHASEKFSDMLWLMQQILFYSADRRVAEFLLREVNESGEKVVCYTHEQIAKLIGSAREVVSRVLKYMEEESAIELQRGKIVINDTELLKKYV